jgi:hypothetical protein
MKGPGGRALSVMTLALAAAPAIACALDFDRYAPLDSRSDSSTIDGPSSPVDVSSEAAPRPDASSADAPVEAPPPGDAGPCSAPPICFLEATSCGMACGQSYQRCLRPCGDADIFCSQPCTSMRQSCLGRCASSCLDCTKDAGCSSSTGCLDATHL